MTQTTQYSPENRNSFALPPSGERRVAIIGVAAQHVRNAIPERQPETLASAEAVKNSADFVINQQLQTDTAAPAEVTPTPQLASDDQARMMQEALDAIAQIPPAKVHHMGN